MSKTTAHVQYKLKDGTRVPGVTTVLGVISKPALIAWANKLGLDGIVVGKYVDALADIGTLAHAMIAAHLAGRECDTSEYSKVTIDKAENSFLSYLEWERKHEIKVLAVECPLVHEAEEYGGTIDCIADLDGIITVLDFKTAKRIYEEHVIQVSAYMELARANEKMVKQGVVLQIGRDETEGFSERYLNDDRIHYGIFQAAKRIYELQRKLKGDEVAG